MTCEVSACDGLIEHCYCDTTADHHVCKSVMTAESVGQACQHQQAHALAALTVADDT